MKKRKFSKKYILLLIIPVIMISLMRVTFAKKTADRDQVPGYERRPLVVKTALAHKGTLTRTLDMVARVEPDKKLEVSSKAMTHVEEIRVSEGDMVQKEDPLLVLDKRDLEQNIKMIDAQLAQTDAQIKAGKARVESLSASLKFWKSESDRDTFLEENGAISLSAAEASRTKYKEVRGSLEDARQSTFALSHQKENLSEQKKAVIAEMDYRIIRAPYSGMVTKINVDPGDMASPGVPLLILENRERLKLVFFVSQNDSFAISEGQELFFQWQGSDRMARVTKVFPSLDEKRMMKVEAELDFSEEETVTPSTGMTLPVRLVTGSLRDVTLVPVSAIFRNNHGHAFTYLVKNNRSPGDPEDIASVTEGAKPVLVVQPLTLLMENGEFAAVTDISVDDEVVISSYKGDLLLADGLEVVVAE